MPADPATCPKCMRRLSDGRAMFFHATKGTQYQCDHSDHDLADRAPALAAEVERLKAERDLAIQQREGEIGIGNDFLNKMNAARSEIDRLREALHRISLASQSSMSSKEECGRIARTALNPDSNNPKPKE